MPDSEKVIRKLQDALENAEEDGKIYAKIRRPVVFDAIAMLKEQEQTIENLNEAVKNLLQQIADIKEYMTPYGKVKDVKAVTELLKEQEPVKPKKIKGFNQPCYVHYAFICENCKTDLIQGQPYCAGCGRSVKWE